MNHPTFDSAGYPTDETLELIRNWDYKDWAGLIVFLVEAWHWKDYISEGRKYLSMSTGGWSGNEDLINALMDNQMIVTLYWKSEERGGHYKFTLPRATASGGGE